MAKTERFKNSPALPERRCLQDGYEASSWFTSATGSVNHTEATGSLA
jgi:hypothetical protein